MSLHQLASLPSALCLSFPNVNTFADLEFVSSYTSVSQGEKEEKNMRFSSQSWQFGRSEPMYSPCLATGQYLKGMQSLYQLYRFFPSLIYFPSAPVSLYIYSYPTCACLSKLPQTPKEDFLSGLLHVGAPTAWRPQNSCSCVRC